MHIIKKPTKISTEQRLFNCSTFQSHSDGFNTQPNIPSHHHKSKIVSSINEIYVKDSKKLRNIV